MRVLSQVTVLVAVLTACVDLPNRDFEGPARADGAAGDPADASDAADASSADDFVAPALELRVKPSGRPARAGEVVEVTLTSDEPLERDSVVLAHDEALPLKVQSSSASRWTWAYTVQAGVEGDYRLEVTARDLAGNEATVHEQVRVDGAPPEVGEVAVPSQPVRSGDPFTVSFGCPDDPPPAFVVEVAGRPMAARESAEEGFDYSFTYTPSGQVDQEGVQEVTVVATDAAENTTERSAALVFDFTAPTLALALAPDDRPAHAGEEVRVTVTSDEPLATLELAELDGDPRLTEQEALRTPTSATWTYTVEDGAEATLGLQAAGVDLAGNEGSTAEVEVTIDGVAPGLSELALSPTWVRRGIPFTVSFDADDPELGLVVQVDGRPMMPLDPALEPPLDPPLGP